MSTDRRPTAIDLFAGAGGLSLGFEQAGFDVVAAVENDPIHAAVHAFNFPDSRLLKEDVANLSGERIAAAVDRHARVAGAHGADIDVVIGGPPCQGFSDGGKRALGDERNDLVFEFARLVRELQPRYFVMENVPGIVSHRNLPILEGLMTKFRSAGYEVPWGPQMLEAHDFGVPQKRRRLFLVGHRTGERAPQIPDPKTETPTVWDAIGDLSSLLTDKGVVTDDELLLDEATLRAVDGFASPYVKKLRGLLSEPENLAYQRDWNTALMTSVALTRHSARSTARFAATAQGGTEPISRFHRLDALGVAHTLRAGTATEHGNYTAARPIHPCLPRVITVREAARLHSYPDWFRFNRTRWHGFQEVGNSVPPLLARAVGQVVAQAMGATIGAPMAAHPTQPVELLGGTRAFGPAVTDRTEPAP